MCLLTRTNKRLPRLSVECLYLLAIAGLLLFAVSNDERKLQNQSLDRLLDRKETLSESKQVALVHHCMHHFRSGEKFPKSKAENQRNLLSPLQTLGSLPKVRNSVLKSDPQGNSNWRECHSRDPLPSYKAVLSLYKQTPRRTSTTKYLLMEPLQS
jgi:hypothetical protein